LVSLLRFSLRPASSLLPRITGVWVVVVVVVVVVKEGLQEKSDAAADVLSKLCDDGGMCTGDRDPEMCDAGDKLLELRDAGDNFPELCDKDKVPEACVVSELSEAAGEVVSVV